jgi:hypothetical protein
VNIWTHCIMRSKHERTETNKTGTPNNAGGGLCSQELENPQ